MRKRYLFLLLVTTVGLGLLIYNYWSYSCGRCNTESLLIISPPAKILLGVNLVSFAVLIYLRKKLAGRITHLTCACGARLHQDWRFCPNCGQVQVKPG
jgi:hypothetical protein